MNNIVNLLCPEYNRCLDYIVRFSKRLNDAKSYLEIGVNYGRAFINALLMEPKFKRVVVVDALNLQFGGQVSSFDHLYPLVNNTCEYKYHPDSKVEYIKGDSKNILPDFLQKNITFDLIFVDGDHSAEGANSDLFYSYKLLTENGILIFDDLANPPHPYLRKVFDTFTKPKINDTIGLFRQKDQFIKLNHNNPSIGIIVKNRTREEVIKRIEELRMEDMCLYEENNPNVKVMKK